MSRTRILTGLIAASCLVLAKPAFATSFNITTSSTAAQTLGPAANETGTIATTGSVTVSGATVAVTISGNGATLTNLGTLKQTGTGRAIRDNVGVSGLTITNGSATNSTALMQSADADVIQMNKTPASITLNNYGTMTSLNASKGGAQAVDFNAILSGSNAINNFATGIMQAQDADAVRPGVNGVIYNAGQIKVSVSSTTGNDGIDAQTNTGVQITNDVNALISGARHGITGGNIVGTGAYTMSVTNNAGATIMGSDGSGLNIDGINGNELVTIVNRGTITGNGVTADGDGVDVDGLVNLNNSGTIRSINAFSSVVGSPENSEGVTVGGGTIINSGTIQGSVATGNTNAIGRGITIAGVDKDAAGNPIPVQAPYGPTTIDNSGLIKGDSDSGIGFTSALASGFATTITNRAGGTIEGGGATVAAIQTGADNDTINNSGLIKADSSGKAIDMGGGNNTLNILGGTASVIGDVSGGTGGTNGLTIDPGAGNLFAYAGSFSNFSAVEVKSGTVRFSGVSTYTGTTKVTGRLELQGANRLSSSSSLDLNGGYLKVTAGGANGQTFASLTLENDSTIDLDNSTSLTFGALGSVTQGKLLSIVNYDPTTSPSYAIRFAGDLTSDSNFAALIADTTVDGGAASILYDGTYTDVFTAVPEVSNFLFGFALLGLVGFRRYRLV